MILSWFQWNQEQHPEVIWVHRQLCTLKPSSGPYTASFLFLSFLSGSRTSLQTNITANQEWNHKVKKSVWGKNICFDVLWPKCEINIRFAQFGVNKCLFVLLRRRGDKGCSVWRDQGGFHGHQTHIWLLPKGRRGWAWTGEQGCSENSSAQLTGLWEWHRDPFFLSPSLGQSLPGPDLWDTRMSPLDRGCAHREIIGSAVSFQVLRLSMAFSAREWMIHLCAITATSFWSHDRQTLSQTCCRLSLGGGSLWIQAGYRSGFG